MNRRIATLSLGLTVLLAVQPANAGVIAAPKVERSAPDALTVLWTDNDPVDVFVSARPDASVTTATLVSNDDRHGRYEMPAAGPDRRYFLLRDSRNGQVVRVAERVLPLERGSNFRDVGGYPAPNGKHVRWGMIYRSGAMPLLTDADVREVQALGLKSLIDLRSNEERVLAPTRLDGIPYTAVGYSMSAITGHGAGEIKNGGALYQTFPALLAPQLRVLFDDLLANKGPIAYNCSAGQDRTGFATAMVLSALGVPRAIIVADYHLSTTYRHPEFEMPKIDTVAHANDPTALFFARYQQNPAAAKPRPLMDANGKPFLASAFEEIEARWGSVDAYLEKEIGIDKVKLASLRAIYLE